MKFELKIETENAAFDGLGGPQLEAARLLRQTAEQLEAGSNNGSLTDINGNNVGNWDMETDRDD